MPPTMKSSRSSLRQIAARVAVLPTFGKPVIPIFGIVSNKPRAPWTGTLYGGPLEKETARRLAGPRHWAPGRMRLADGAAALRRGFRGPRLARRPASTARDANAFGRPRPVRHRGQAPPAALRRSPGAGSPPRRLLRRRV